MKNTKQKEHRKDVLISPQMQHAWLLNARKTTEIWLLKTQLQRFSERINLSFIHPPLQQLETTFSPANCFAKRMCSLLNENGKKQSIELFRLLSFVCGGTARLAFFTDRRPTTTARLSIGCDDPLVRPLTVGASAHLGRIHIALLLGRGGILFY